MDMYAEVKKLNERVERGELDLLEIREELRRMRAERLTDTQLATAIASDPGPELEGDDVRPCGCGAFSVCDVCQGVTGDEVDEIPVTPEAVDAASDALAAIEGAEDELEAETHTPERVIHVSPGTYEVNETITIPSGTTIVAAEPTPISAVRRKPGRPRKG